MCFGVQMPAVTLQAHVDVSRVELMLVEILFVHPVLDAELLKQAFDGATVCT